MARIRTIKPEFPQSESMGRVSRDARLAFIMLWTIADDSGRLRGNSRMLASLLFPYDDDAKECIESWLCELEDQDCIIRYRSGNDSYLQICKWNEHQKIDKPSKSKIPEFGEDSRGFERIREVSSGDQGSRTKDQGKEEAKASTVVAEAVSGEPKAKKRRTRDEITQGYPEHVRAVVNFCHANWRKEDPDGRPITTDIALLSLNVDSIFRSHPEASSELLINAAKAYLSKEKFRYCAPQFFFGRGRGEDQPAWIAEYRFAQHQAQRQLEAHALGRAS